MKVHKCDGDGKVDWVVVKSTIRRDALHFKLTRVKPFSHTVNWVGLEEKTGIAEGGRAETDLAAANRERLSRYRETPGNLIKQKRSYPTKKAHPRTTIMEATVTGIPTLACDQKLTEML